MRGTQPSQCPMDALLKLLMGPWTTYILWILRTGGALRFGALKQQVAGISAKVLTARLRALEAAGIIYRDYEPTVPPAVTYGLTPRGRDLDAVLDALNDVALRWQVEDDGRAGAQPSGRSPTVDGRGSLAV
jgi:DNA-binding HxlR family transcriptional regulator